MSKQDKWLQQEWKRFSPVQRDQLEEVLHIHGTEAARAASKVLAQQYQEQFHTSTVSAISQLTPLPQCTSLKLGQSIPACLNLLDVVPCATVLGCNAIQIFLGDPNYMRFASSSQKLRNSFYEHIRKAHISTVVVHASFAINLPSIRKRARNSSLTCLKGTIKIAQKLHAHYVVLHIGRYQGPDPDQGIEFFLQGMQHSYSGIETASPMVLLENGFGDAHSLGSKLEELGTIYKKLAQLHPQKSIGVCLDTAHLWSAGYDLSTVKASRRVLHYADQRIGLAHIKVIHLNSSLAEKGSGIDKHATWDEGLLPLTVLANWVRDPRLSHVTWIVEPPHAGIEIDEKYWQREQKHMASITERIKMP